ncbi:MAG: hypothetical protein LBF26_01125 [Puniceicoccales bacterium]|nr:hypothetical protein [Puniceicoccales bacterium]
MKFFTEIFQKRHHNVLVDGVSFKRADFARALADGNDGKVAKEDGLSWKDMATITENLESAGLSAPQASSFGRFYELTAKQDPKSSQFDNFQRALAEYKEHPTSADKQLALFETACKLVFDVDQTLKDQTDVNFKSALANACLGAVEGLKDLATKDGFKPGDDKAADWPQGALPSLQGRAAVAKLNKRGIPVQTCTVDKAIELAKSDPPHKIIGSKIENGKLVFCELVLNEARDGLVEKKNEETNKPIAYETSKKFAQTFAPTEGQTAVVNVPPKRPEMNAEHVTALKECITEESHKTADDATIWNVFCALADEKEKVDDDGRAALLNDIQNDADGAKARFNALLANEIAKKAAAKPD